MCQSCFPDDSRLITCIHWKDAAATFRHTDNKSRQAYCVRALSRKNAGIDNVIIQSLFPSIWKFEMMLEILKKSVVCPKNESLGISVCLVEK